MNKQQSEENKAVYDFVYRRLKNCQLTNPFTGELVFFNRTKIAVLAGQQFPAINAERIAGQCAKAERILRGEFRKQNTE